MSKEAVVEEVEVVVEPEYPMLSDGEVSVTFYPLSLWVTVPFQDSPIKLDMTPIKRNYMLINMNTENMYDMLKPYIREV